MLYRRSFIHSWPSLVLTGWCMFWVAMPLHLPLPLLANPSGGTVVGGSANISGGPGQTTVNQSSQRAVINWRDFSIKKGETTTFVQPNSSSATLNRVTGPAASHINGRLNANGRVYLVNPNGVVIGKSGRVNTAGFTASTLDVSDQQFLAGKDLTFSGNSTAKVVNKGKIKAMDGDITLIARQVENHGSLSARNGRVQLAAGTEVLIKTAGEERVFIKSDAKGAPGETGVLNTGKIRAAMAELKAAGGNEYALAINNSGIIRAGGSRTERGRVLLTSSGGRIVNSGKIRAVNHDGSGGEVRLTGGSIQLKRGSVIDVSAKKSTGGRGGTILVGGEWQGGGTMEQAREVTVEAGAELRADAAPGPNGTAAQGGKVVVWSTGRTDFSGYISAVGTEDSPVLGGWVETSGHSLNVGLDAFVITNGGEWLLDPVTLEVVTGGSGPGSIVGGVNVEPHTTIDPATVVAALAVNNVTLLATGSITITDAINSSANPGTARNLILNAPTLFLNNSITLKTGANLSGNATLVNVAGAGRIQNAVHAVAANGTVSVAAGTYIENVSINKSLTLNGAGAATTTMQGTGTGAVLTIASGGHTVNISGITITNGAGSNGGGITIANGGTVTLNAVTVRNNNATGSGAGIYSNNARLEIIDSTIRNNTSTGSNGGGIGIVGASSVFILTNSTVSNNTIANYGGGIYITGGITANISGSTITNNTTTLGVNRYGGGLYINNNGGTTTITNSNIRTNTSGDRGAGIHNLAGTLNITGGSVADNVLSFTSSSSGGAGIYNAGTLTLTNASVDTNRSPISGGGIYNAAGTLTLDNTDVVLNQTTSTAAGNYGAGIYSAGGTVTIRNGSLVSQNTTVSGSGGGIAILSSGNTLTIEDSTVSFNTAFSGGGGIYVGTGTVTLTNANIDDNTLNASGNGGGLFIGGGTLTVTGGTMSRNTAGDRGGALYSTIPDISITGTTFSANRTTTTAASLAGGGAFYNNGGTATITNSTFTGNQAVNAGGAIYNYFNAGIGSITLNNVTVTSNGLTATTGPGNGGGIYSNGVVTILNNSTISFNTTIVGSGGGIHVTSANSVLTIMDSSVNSNSTSSGGGGILANGGRIFLTRVDVNDNATLGGGSAGGGLSIASSVTEASIVDSNFLRNRTFERGGGIINASLDLEITGSEIRENVTTTSTANYSGGGGLYNNNGVIVVRDTIIAGNIANQYGGGIHNFSTGLGSVELIDSTVSGNSITSTTTTNGGGIYINGGATTILTNTDVLSNTSGSGAGIFSASNANVLTITDSSISGNTAVSNGGGLYASGGTVTINNGTIADNIISNGNGGGITLTGTAGTIRINGTDILRNRSTSGGGGISVISTVDVDIELRNVDILENSVTGASGTGGGVFLGSTPRVVFYDSTISSNTAGTQGGGIYVTGSSGGTGTLYLTNVTVNGNSTLSTVVTTYGGGIFNNGYLSITDSFITNNFTSSNFTGSQGGGIYNSSSFSTLNITRTHITGNTTYAGGGGVSIGLGAVSMLNSDISGNTATYSVSSGGGIYTSNSALLRLEGMTIANNSASRGGGLFNASTNALGDIEIYSSTFYGNTATGDGGAIYNTGTDMLIWNSTIRDNVQTSTTSRGGALYQGTATAALVVENSAIYNNEAAQGGAFFISAGSATIRNSTVANNDATSTNASLGGGGLSATTSTIVLENSTISGNTAVGRGGGLLLVGGAGSVLSIRNTIIAGNTGPTSAASGVDVYSVANVAVIDNGNNLIGATDGMANAASLLLDQAANPNTYTQAGTFASRKDPGLAPLGNYGGTTFTMALLVNSLALGRGSIPASADTDQRGQERTAGVHSDIGAFEAQAVSMIPTYVVTTTADYAAGAAPITGSLRLATSLAEAPSTVTFNIPQAGNAYDAGTGTWTITADATRGGFSVQRAMTIDATTQPGYATATGVAIVLRGNGASVLAVDAGAGSAVTLRGLALTGGLATNGGGLRVVSGKVSLSTAEIYGNTASGYGGGVAVEGGSLATSGVTITANTAGAGGGGGVYVASGGTAQLENTTIALNSTTGNGGGVYAGGTTVSLTNVTVAQNNAVDGGGIYATAAPALLNTLVARNTSGGAGPDVSGALTDSGYNLIGDGSGSTGWGATSQVGTAATPLDPLISALGYYGGKTRTIALLPGSLALNAGTSSGAPAADQRGASRVGVADIGAFESQGFTYTVVSGSGQTAVLDQAYGAPLIVEVQAVDAVEPIAGGQVTLVVPDNGPSGLGTLTITLNGSNQASFTLTAHRAVGSYLATVAGSPGTAFSLTNSPIALLITPNSLQGKTYGEADPATGLGYSITGTLMVGDTALSGALSRDNGEDAGSYLINQGTLTSANNPNYTITFSSTPVYFTIGRRSITINPTAGQQKVYGEADPSSLSFSVGGSGLGNGDQISDLSGALVRATGEDVAAYAIGLGTLTSANNSNYTITLGSAVDFNITPRSITISPTAGQQKVYGEADPSSLSFSVGGSGLGNGDQITDLSGALVRATGEDVAAYAIGLGTLTSANNPNYTITLGSAVDFNITPRSITINPTAGQQKVYGEADPSSLSFSVGGSGLGNGDQITDLIGALVRATGDNVAAYAIGLGTLTSANNPNYTITLGGSVDFNITARAITVTPRVGQTKFYGETDPVLLYDVGGLGLGNGDTSLNGALARATGEDAGAYAISEGTVTTANNPNYVVTFTGAPTDFTILQRLIEIIPVAGQHKYVGQADPELTYTVGGMGLAFSDVLNGTLMRAPGEGAGYYLIGQGSLTTANNPNYAVAFSGTPVQFEIAALPPAPGGPSLPPALPTIPVIPTIPELPLSPDGPGTSGQNGAGLATTPNTTGRPGLRNAGGDLSEFNATRGRNNESEDYYLIKPKERARNNFRVEHSRSGGAPSGNLLHMSSYDIVEQEAGSQPTPGADSTGGR
ncbi:hypothetical protein DB346_12440 [Verrucomicrobia bacterium LW23]|nr:hypothetical protein DB346_12440 [Verrucomicrobia bacterium LW23]